MTPRNGTDTANAELVALQPPEVLEARLAPMFMCCGWWSYSFTFGLNGPGIVIGWTEDGDAACNQP
jgi:hypothetical protein